MRQLRELDIDGVKEFGLAHYARLAAALPDTTGRTLVPHFHIPGWSACKKCRGQVVVLNAAPPRARRFLCVSCQAGLIEAHVARWNRAKADAAASA